MFIAKYAGKRGAFVASSTKALASGLLLLACTSSVATAEQRPADDKTIAELNSTLDKLVKADQFSGVVLFAKHGKVLFERAYGQADRAFAVPNRLDTKFNFASMGKMFTAVAIMQLVEQGKISLDDRLSVDLPDYPNKEVSQKITIRQLLSHTSGLADFFGRQFADSNMSRFDTLESLLPLFVDKPLQFEPGTKWSYSNAGFIVLGLVIQRVSGQSYYDYVREHVYKPAGMVNTDNWPADADVPNRAVGYTYAGQPEHAPRKSNIFMLQRGGSAGGGYSTVEDLFHFAEALESHKLLSKNDTELLTTGQFATHHEDARYGLGFEETLINGVRIVGHSGGGPGIQCILDVYPNDGYIVAIMTNYDNAMAAVDARLRSLLSGKLPPAEKVLDRTSLAIFGGDYAPIVPEGIKIMGTPPPITVTPTSVGIDVNPGMGPSFHFVPISDIEFVDEDNPTLHLLFEKDAGGQVRWLKTTTGFGPVPPITATSCRNGQSRENDFVWLRVVL